METLRQGGHLALRLATGALAVTHPVASDRNVESVDLGDSAADASVRSASRRSA
jgi:hypothetical protein